jgi:lysophospholipase L1-like esterase
MLTAFVFTLSLLTNTVEAKGPGGSNIIPIIQQANPASITTDEDKPSVPLLLSAEDANGDALTWGISTVPAKGTVSISAVSSSRGKSTINVKYTPRANLNGADSFVVRVSDGKTGGMAYITVNVTINAVNDSPINTVVPTISGATTAGSTLTVSQGTWTDDSQELTYLYQWQKADNAQGLNITNLPESVPSNSYTLSSGDSGKYIRVSVTVKDENLSSTAYSSWILIPSKAINYVSLGDSIATGSIYTGKVISSYVTYFYQYLQTQNPTAQVNVQKLATNGYRTNDIYVKLGLAEGTIMDAVYENAIKGASIITISLGGNNLMQAAKDSSSYSGYNFNVVNDAIAQQGVKDFNDQWAPIINKIRELNSNAQIIVTTVYNPFNELSDSTLHNQIDSYLFRLDGTGVNDVITSSSNMGYSVADVYKAFNDSYSNNMGVVTYFYPSSWDIAGILTRNPHPNVAGQDIITRLHKEVYIPIN